MNDLMLWVINNKKYGKINWFECLNCKLKKYHKIVYVISFILDQV